VSTPLNPALVPPIGATQPAPSQASRTTPATDGSAFAATMLAQRGTVSFSNHALQRIERRGIQVDPATLQRLDTAVDRAAAKGAKESVVLVDQTAFVVSVKNRTVITAVGRDQMRDQVFTNIDSAVVA
jgi:flagellar operon protein